MNNVDWKRFRTAFLFLFWVVTITSGAIYALEQGVSKILVAIVIAVLYSIALSFLYDLLEQAS